MRGSGCGASYMMAKEGLDGGYEVIGRQGSENMFLVVIQDVKDLFKVVNC